MITADQLPADDAEPLTGDWLRSVGFANRAFPDHGNPLCIKVGLTGLLAVWTNGATRLAIRGYYEPAAECSTRGDVRRLCAALGVELKGGE